MPAPSTVKTKELRYGEAQVCESLMGLENPLSKLMEKPLSNIGPC
tara:strand:+ start:412 stop:546 length:135 start_codon:yes stop_codon:yes gene_type:complete